MNFKEELNAKVKQVETVIDRFLPAEEGEQKRVIEAMNYSFLAGGKRLRPLFMQETYHLFGGNDSVIEYFMAAIEMIHTYSLVHDDLPAMDNDEFRRGRQTTHIVYGEAMGILAGDGLLNYAFETAARAFDHTEHPYEVGKAMQVLAQKAGINGMLGGQCADVEAEGKKITRQQLDFIHRYKTGAMLESSMMIPAILAGASQSDITCMCSVAGDVGLAFQIQDDILDVTSTTKILGKPVGSDEKNHKITYVTMVGLDQAKHDVQMISDRALANLQRIEGDKKFLMELIRYLIHREK